MTAELRLGRWEDVLADVDEVDSLIPDPPFGKRTHDGQRHGRKDARYTGDKGCILSARGLPYDYWTPEDVCAFVDAWVGRVRGWFLSFTSHDLWSVYAQRLEAAGRYVFHPIPCIQMHRNVRLAGDGPASWADYLVVSRPRTQEFARWGSLPGCYVGPCFDPGENALDRSKRVPGGKPLWMMRAIVRDYTRAGDFVCDPCAGGGTTLVAARLEGRPSIGAEIDEVRHAYAAARIARSHAPLLPLPDPFEGAVQSGLFAKESGP